jgi:oligoendopeptidase F
MTSTTQSKLGIDQLPRYQKRDFVPEKAQLTELGQVQALYTRLSSREFNSSQDFGQWILDRSELEAALEQEGTILYIRMTCQTDDESRVKSYENFIKTIVPAIKPLKDQLNKKYLKSVERFKLEEKRYEVYTRAVQTNVEIFVQDNIELQTKEKLLSNEYQTICGAMTVQFEGKERTLPEMGRFLLETDRTLRERAWKETAQRRLKDKDNLDEIFDKMVSLRNQIAQNAQCSNFCDYQFRSLHRFDYSPDDCKKYQESVERLVVPLWIQICESRRKQMQLDILRPWDTTVDPAGRPALRPFEDVEDLVKGCQNIFNRVDETLGKQFTDIARSGLLDLASRKGKAPGGYQSTLNEARKPFIFMNAVGTDSDVRTLLHEGGHAFHSLACAHDPLVDYRHGPMEFNEVASMGMELLAGEYMAEFYNTEDVLRSQKSHWEDIIFTLVWVATIDAFQHWIYENPNHNRLARTESWLNIRRRFGGDLMNWDGFEEEHGYLWHRQLHIFECPFYYIEYGIAQLGALQLWLNAKRDWKTALANFRKALALGGSRPLPDLYETAGIRFDFSEATIAPLMSAVKNELGKYS